MSRSTPKRSHWKGIAKRRCRFIIKTLPNGITRTCPRRAKYFRDGMLLCKTHFNPNRKKGGEK